MYVRACDYIYLYISACMYMSICMYTCIIRLCTGRRILKAFVIGHIQFKPRSDYVGFGISIPVYICYM